jgi:hypothetical protein
MLLSSNVSNKESVGYIVDHLGKGISQENNIVYYKNKTGRKENG